ncbi:MAG: hypothetical protein U1F60_10555 [Planctomycetota bacterium]
MARLVLAVGVVVLLALAGWLAFAAGPIAPLLPEAAPKATDASAATPVEATADAPAATEERDLERSSAPTLEGSDLLPIPADAKWVDVLVLDQQTKQPVEGAEAIWWDGRVHEEIGKLPEAERTPFYRDQDQVAQRWGRRGRSDRDGKLRVHLGKQWTIVQARHAGRFGTTNLHARGEPPNGGYRVLLEQDCTVRVHVVDAEGRPAVGIAVSLENYDPEQARPSYVGGELQTDADGLATFAHVQQRRTVRWGAKEGQPVAQWRLFLGIPGLEMPPILIDAVQVPSEPVEVQLPATGRLRAKVTMGGRPMPDLQVGFHVGPRDDWRTINATANGSVDPDGWVRFRYVPLGKTLFVMARQSASHLTRELPGPTVPEQEVEIVFDLAAESIVVTGRLLHDDGQPIAGQSVGGSFDASRSRGGISVTTDAAGRFVWWIGIRRDGEDATMRLNQLAFEWRPAKGSALRVEVPPRDLVVGTNDLGDLRFGVAELVAAGRFVFDSPGDSRTWLTVTRSEGPPRTSGEERWERVDGLQVDVKEDGRFEVRGNLPPGRQRIEVQATQHLPVEPVEFAVGTRDLVIPVQRGFPLRASCLLPDGLASDKIQLRLQPRDEANRTKPSDLRTRLFDRLHARAQAKSDGTTPYAWFALPAGTYDLRIEAAGSAEPFVEVPNVVVPSPEGGDPRLLEIDLRELVTMLRVRVAGPSQDQTRRETPMVFVLPQANELEWQGILANTELVLPVPKRPVDLLVACEGCRPVTLRGVVDGATVTMEPWPTVAVAFQGLEALPAGALLQAAAHAARPGKRDERGYRTQGRSGMLSHLLAPSSYLVDVQDGAVSLPIGDGVYSLSVYLRLGPDQRPKGLKQLTPNQLVAGAPVTVQLSADEIRSVVADLQQQAAKAKAQEGK